MQRLIKFLLSLAYTIIRKQFNKKKCLLIFFPTFDSPLLKQNLPSDIQTQLMHFLTSFSHLNAHPLNIDSPCKIFKRTYFPPLRVSAKYHGRVLKFPVRFSETLNEKGHISHYLWISGLIRTCFHNCSLAKSKGAIPITFQILAHIMSANISLPKASHMTNFNTTGQRSKVDIS